MKKIRRIAQGADVRAIHAQLEANAPLWDQHPLRTAGYESSPHQQLSDIWVRYNAIGNLDRENPAAFNESHESVWYPAWEQLTALHPLVFNTMHFVRGTRLGGVLITKIPAHGLCAPHVDTGWHATYYEKFALSIDAAPGQVFKFDDDELVTQRGDLFTFDNSFKHWVTNESEEDRITLIMCIRR